MRDIYVICYDISDDKTRRFVEKKLLNYGLRVQYSVFECMLTKWQLDKLRAELRHIIDSRSDAMHYFHLCQHCIGKRSLQGTAKPLAWRSFEWVG